MATLTIELPENVTQGQMIAMLETINCDLRLAGDGRNYKAHPRKTGRRVTGDALEQVARDYREAWGHEGGYIVLCDGVPVAWKRFLDGASSWEPGCIAIDEDGRKWVAAGGDENRGALRWDALGEPGNVARLPARLRTVPTRGSSGPGAA
ncbi:hypothetical protein ACJO2E_02610 [Marinobacter sp. M1N3S26]|uniref:hypothetical protein n=1 Tax=Marinobacter sp. M1N3S26 TaxID=3382299 RepID=UPI00387B92F3